MFTRDFLVQALPASGTSLKAKNISRLWTDSRSIKNGDLFIAIKGDIFDGHDFVAGAAEKGAVAALVSRSDFKGREKLPADFSLIQVPDTVAALRSVAKTYRTALKIPIFAIAGSNGKTTTKEWIAFWLSELHGSKRIFKTAKSQNSILGIAMSLLQIRNEEMAVIEIGIDEPGWMDQHLEVVQPTHGVITSIAEEHLSKLKNIETVANEELKLLKFLKKQLDAGFAANLDSAWISQARKDFPPNTLTYSLEKSAQIEGSFMAPHTLHAFGIEWTNPLPGKHNAQNLLASLTALRLLHPHFEPRDLAKLASKTWSFKNEAHRSHWFSIDKNIQIFDDSYNANPESMERSLQAFIELSDGCHQRVVLGDMLDLGDHSDDAHRRILNLAIVLGFDFIYLFGPEFEKAFNRMSSRPKNVRSFQKLDDLASAISEEMDQGDAIFLKGSHGMALERLLPSLGAEVEGQ